MYDPTLKPCPFCGSERVHLFEQQGHCWACGAYGPFQTSMVDKKQQERGVREKWNGRDRG